MKKTTLALAAALLAAHGPAAAQVRLEPEQRIRIRAPEAGIPRLTAATVLQAGPDTLLVQTSQRDTIRGGAMLDQRLVPVSQIVRLDVRGAPRSRAAGTLMGGGIGAASGLAAVALHMKFSKRGVTFLHCDTSPDCPWPPRRRLEPYDRDMGVRIVGAATAIGLVTGFLRAGNEWQRVRAPVTLQAAAAEGGQLQLGARITF